MYKTSRNKTRNGTERYGMVRDGTKQHIMALNVSKRYKSVRGGTKGYGTARNVKEGYQPHSDCHQAHTPGWYVPLCTPVTLGLSPDSPGHPGGAACQAPHTPKECIPRAPNACAQMCTIVCTSVQKHRYVCVCVCVCFISLRIRSS